MMRATRTCLTLFGLIATDRAVAQTIDTLPAHVDGRRTHMVAMGKGSPTVILEAGAGGTSRMWTQIQRDLARTHRVVAYDRAGHGRSELGPRSPTARVVAEDLRAALRSVGISPPYVLVGHSAGGLYARVFAGAYPDDVVGLVLLDPAPEDFYARAEREFPRVYAYFDSVDAADTVGITPGERAENDAWETTLSEARQSDGHYRGRTILLSSPRADLKELGAIWTDEHRRWVSRDRGREYVRLDGAGHAIHRERPDAVLGAVRRVLAESRKPSSQ